jgi:chemotaxis protein methyltransferase CheR
MPCSEKDYAYLRELVLTESANFIDPSRNALFETRLATVAHLCGAEDLTGFVQMLRNKRPERMHRTVAEAMMINETSFFRDYTPFELLRKSILPRLIEQRKNERTLRIWSAASSTGQEAYSLAMMLRDAFPQLAGWDVSIIATDISQSARDYARNGRYRRLEVNRGLPARSLLRHFVRDGEEWELSEAIRSMVEFKPINLCAPLPRLPKFDLVLLRNVLLYFPTQDRGCLLSDVHRLMREDGMLLLGNAEQAEDSSDLFDVQFDEDCYYYKPHAA